MTLWFSTLIKTIDGLFSGVFHSDNMLYNTTRILDSTGCRFSLSNYEAYSALYLPGPYAIIYLLVFALSTALLVHTVLYHTRTIYNGIPLRY